jgi:transposase
MSPDQETRDKIVAAYKGGHRIHDIEEEFDVKRSTLYYVLDQAGVLPARANRGEKLKGNTEALASLFEILSVQERYVKSLEALLEANGIEIPDELEEGW